MNFEAVLKAAGGFGLYQWILLLFYQIGIFGIGSNMLFMIFGGYFRKCTSSQSFQIQNSSLSSTGALFSNDSEVNVNRTCDRYFYSIVDEWDLDREGRKHIPNLVLTIQMVGVFFGPLVGGQIADTYGRRVAMLIGYTMMSVCGVASAFSVNWQMFAVARFLIGFFAGAVGSAHYVLFVEVVPSKWRQATFFGGWPLGYIWTGAMAYATRDWRMLSIAINGLGIIPVALLIFWVCESPKWLLEKHRIDDAKSVFEYIAKRNGARVSMKEFDRQVESFLLNIEQEAPVEKQKYSYHDLFRGWTMAVYTLALFYCCFAISSVTYIIVFGLGKLAGDPAINTMLTGVVRLPLSLIAAGLDRKAKWFGRRILHQSGLLLTAACLLAMSVLLITNRQAIKTTPYAGLSMLTVGFCTLIWMAVGFYQQEIFPTALRTMGNALCSCASRLGNVLAGQILILETLWHPLPNIAMATLVISNSILVFFLLPETKGKPLPDLSYRNQIIADITEVETAKMISDPPSENNSNKKTCSKTCTSKV